MKFINHSLIVCVFNLYTFTPGRGYLDNIVLVSAKLGPGKPANWVENCSCPAGYEGQFCEYCAAGYKRRFPGQGARSHCEPCACHGGSCDPETGTLVRKQYYYTMIIQQNKDRCLFCDFTNYTVDTMCCL